MTPKMPETPKPASSRPDAGANGGRVPSAAAVRAAAELERWRADPDYQAEIASVREDMAALRAW
ncbi:hypothetical protein [Streptomyces sp. YIM S03343]